MSARRAGAALLLGLLAACRGGETDAAETSAEASGGPIEAAARPALPGSRARITGTAVEAATGRPVEGVEVLGPAGSRAWTDAAGRFELVDLPAGLAGALEARGAGGLVAQNRLRPLRAGTLEVVLRLRPVE